MDIFSEDYLGNLEEFLNELYDDLIWADEHGRSVPLFAEHCKNIKRIISHINLKLDIIQLEKLKLDCEQLINEDGQRSGRSTLT